ncbi:sorting nexin-17-like isoform X2 [Lethenteron reissneri]|uniref:sorting nexin-17-like isoform X2 n=1 Tax=Lethenteron reissneri TaxID=7753 RepID=UPI002AB6FFA5|nr:sorting nexin-17-like isoform X2 [Lethenteron reissneri]
MHFSIPDTEEWAGEAARFVTYNIHVNGALHCRVRYSQMHGLHEQLKRCSGGGVGQMFPPKRLLPLSSAQVEQRRELLERYIQAVSQDPVLGTSEVFHSFLRKAQQDTQQVPSQAVQLQVLLANGQMVSVHVESTHQTDDILEAVAAKLELPEELVHYFALFLVRDRGGGAFSFIRRLQEFELPYISVTSLQSLDYKIVLRKSYWDTAYDDDIMESIVGLNLLYIQAVSDVERGWIVASKEQLQQLKSLQDKGSKKEYIQFSQTLKYYGYLQFDPCVTDFPEKGCKVIVAVGNKELNFRVLLSSDQAKEGSFKVTRMRCWRVASCVTTAARHGAPSVAASNGLVSAPPLSATLRATTSPAEVRLELAFEYLITKDKLQWISISSQQAIMMSICLQGMVDELMIKKSGGKIRKMKRGRLSSRAEFSNKHSPPQTSPESAKELPTVRVSSKLSSMSLRGLACSASVGGLASRGSQVRGGSGDGYLENDAFEGIGDDDL